MCLPLAVLGPILGGAVAAGGSAAASAIGSGNAAAAQGEQAQKALDLQRQMYWQNRSDQKGMYDQTRLDQAPWLQSGQSSLGELMRQMGAGDFDTSVNPQNIANDPGYQFRMQQGQKALERSASARGMLNSGGALKSLDRYSQGMASDEYQNAWNRNQAENTGRYNRLAGLAGVGQQAAQTLGNAGSAYGNAMGQANANFGNQGFNSYGALGNAQAAGAMGGANAFSGGMQTLGNMSQMYGMWNMLKGSGYGGGYGGGSIPTQGQSTGYAGSSGYSPSFGLDYGGR